MSGRHLDTHSGTDAERVAITIVRGEPTPEELAAVTAVLTAMAQESADDAIVASSGAPSAWHRSAGSLRQPLHPGPGAWRGFSG